MSNAQLLGGAPDRYQCSNILAGFSAHFWYGRDAFRVDLTDHALRAFVRAGIYTGPLPFSGFRSCGWAAYRAAARGDLFHGATPVATIVRLT